MARGIKSLHPIILFIYYLGMMVWIITMNHLLTLTLSLLVLILLNLILDGGNKMYSWRKAIIIMALFILIATPLFNRRGTIVLFYLFNNPVVLEAVFLGVQIALQYVNLILLVITLPLMFPTTHFLYLFAKLSPQWALLIMLGIRFIPTLKNQITEMQNVQRVKYGGVNKLGWMDKIRHLMQQVKSLLANSLETSLQVADSMTARGYSYGPRTYYHEFSMKTQDWVVLIALALTNGVMILSFARGQLTIGANELAAQSNQWFFLLVWLILSGVPVFVEGKEWVKWQFLQSTN